MYRSVQHAINNVRKLKINVIMIFEPDGRSGINMIAFIKPSSKRHYQDFTLSIVENFILTGYLKVLQSKIKEE